MATKKTVPSIPAVTTQDNSLRALLMAMKEALEVRLGHRGDPLDRAPTLRELYDNGVIALYKNGKLTYNSGGGGDFGSGTQTQGDTSTPDPPTNVQYTATPEVIILTWAKPVRDDIVLTEIWRNDIDDRDTADLTGVSSGQIYADTVGPAATKYYWVRFLSEAGIYSEYHAINGLEATTPLDPAAYLELLSGQITETELYAALNTRLDKIEDNEVAIATEEVTRANETGELYGQFTIKVDAGGAIAGFGLASTNNTFDGLTHTEAQFSVDRFSIVSPGKTSASFVVDGTKVVMDAAFIKEATITDAHITTLGVTKLVGDTAAFVTANILDASITTAKIEDNIHSDNFVQGASGWAINSATGNCEFNTGKFRGDITGANGEFAGTLSADSVSALSELLVGNIRTPLEVDEDFFTETSTYSDDATPDTNWAENLVNCLVTVPHNTPRVRIGFYSNITYIRNDRYHYKCDLHLKRNIAGAGWVTIKTWQGRTFGSLLKNDESLNNYLVGLLKPAEDYNPGGKTLYSYAPGGGEGELWYPPSQAELPVPPGGAAYGTSIYTQVSFDDTASQSPDLVVPGYAGYGASLDLLLSRYGIFAEEQPSTHFDDCSYMFVDYPAATAGQTLEYRLDLYVQEVSGHRLDVRFGTRRMALALD